MRISDWSSDVCSSDLAGIVLQIRFGRWQRGVHDRMPPSPADRPKNLAYLLLGAIVSLIINDDGNPLEQALINSGHYASSLTKDTTKLAPRSKRSDLSATSIRSEEHTSELQSLMRISYAVFC